MLNRFELCSECIYKKGRKTRHSRLIFQPKIEEEGTRDIVDDDFVPLYQILYRNSIFQFGWRTL